MIRRPPRSTQSRSSAASDVYKRQDFFYSLSDNSLYRRFISYRQDMPHERLQDFVIIDYTKEMVILAFLPEGEKEEIAGLGQYVADEATQTADVSFVVRDAYQNLSLI